MKTYIFGQSTGNEIEVCAENRMYAEDIMEEQLTEIEVNYNFTFGEGKFQYIGEKE